MDNSQIWVDKYRPKKFEDIIGQEYFIKRVKNFIQSKSLPHILFSGSPGIGKTTTALVIANELYGENSLGGNCLELNASDDRGIDIIRTKIKDFAKLKSLAQIPYKIIILDEADSLTREAQQALRRTMEKYSKGCRFILCCNEISKILDPIQSRCVIFKFKSLTKKDIIDVINKVEKTEELEIEESAKEFLFEICKGDMRKLINTIQAAGSFDKKITDKIINEIVDFVNPKEIKEMIDLAINGYFLKSRDKLIELKGKKGLTGIEIIKEIYYQIIKNENINENIKVKLIDKIATIEFRIIEGSSEEIQIESLLATISLVLKKIK
jgi:replication factor C small subunit